MAEIFTKEESGRLMDAIKKAELGTSGEIRVHAQHKLIGDVFVEAKAKFEELGMTETELRNGVLIFIAVDEKKFAVLGDKGIDDVVPEGFWNSTVAKMTDFFKKGELVGGVEAGILEAGKVLKQYFPYQSDDVNELANEISVED